MPVDDEKTSQKAYKSMEDGQGPVFNCIRLSNCTYKALQHQAIRTAPFKPGCVQKETTDCLGQHNHEQPRQYGIPLLTHALWLLPTALDRFFRLIAARIRLLVVRSLIRSFTGLAARLRRAFLSKNDELTFRSAEEALLHPLLPVVTRLIRLDPGAPDNQQYQQQQTDPQRFTPMSSR